MIEEEFIMIEEMDVIVDILLQLSRLKDYIGSHKTELHRKIDDKIRFFVEKLDIIDVSINDEFVLEDTDALIDSIRDLCRVSENLVNKPDLKQIVDNKIENFVGKIDALDSILDALDSILERYGAVVQR